MRGNDDIVQENERLQKELRQLQARVHAMESSRWFRLHPRLALQRLRRRSSDGDDAASGLGQATESMRCRSTSTKEMRSSAAASRPTR